MMAGSWPPRRRSVRGGAAGRSDLDGAFEGYLNRPGWRLLATRVLVLEDNALNMKFFRDLLEVLGHAVIGATSGDDVIGLARDHRPDVIVMDIGGNAVAGLDLCQRLRSVPGLEQLPIIAIADPLLIVRGDLRVRDFAGLLTKPIPLRPFLRTLERSFGAAAPGGVA